MTPEEKTKELFNKICKASEPMFHSSELVRSEWIKICNEQTLIAVDELIQSFENYKGMHDQEFFDADLNYWNEVKIEIEKL